MPTEIGESCVRRGVFFIKYIESLFAQSIELSRPNLRLDALPMSVFKRYESLVDVVVWDSSLCSLLPAGLFDDYSVRGCAVPPPDASTVSAPTYLYYLETAS